MSASGLFTAVSFDSSACGRLIEDLLQKLFPICRSITGEGLRSTVNILADQIPLQLIELPSGTKVFDWEIPDEWNIRDAFIKNVKGERVVDFQASNLHVVNYSIPVHRWMKLDELKSHLHSLPSQPDAIPYLTTYYRKNWGFCLTHDQYQNLPDGEYEVCIDSTLEPGSLTIAEALLPGESDKEILFSTYCCHPSMANNELSGPIITTLLYKLLASFPKRYYSYRFYYGVETIGALAYLSRRGDHLKNKLAGGLVVTCCGDRGQFTYKKARNPENILDKAILHTLRHSGVEFQVVSFFPSGSDERQYCSPGFDLPVGSLMRSMYGTYPEYHTSLDNLDFVSVETLLQTLAVYINCIYVLEHNQFYKNLKPFGEPMLSKYGLYHFIGAQKGHSRYTRLLRYILNFSDGQHDLVDIADLMALPIWECEGAVKDLMAAGLITILD